jgi:hypothetical protein
LEHPPAAAIAGPDGWRDSTEYLDGIALFNAGYYWEAHEAWERIWHAHGRRGPVADLLKALIKLAAAGVKAREGRQAGVATHARRAAGLIGSVAGEAGPRLLGLELAALEATARAIADSPPAYEHPRDAAVARVFDFSITPG